MAYTISQLDEAISNVIGREIHQLIGFGNRTLLLDTCAKKLWINQTPEDGYTRVIREALRDLGAKGILVPTKWDVDDDLR